MASTETGDIIESLTLEQGAPPDRLPPMLFLAALVHGILIIGVTFNAILGDAASEAISLEVTIVADPERNAVAPEDADYLAQASHEGAGNTDQQARPTAQAASPVPVDNLGDVDGDSIADLAFVDELTDQLLTTTADSDLKLIDETRLEHTPDGATAALLEAGADLTLPLPNEDVANLAIHDESPRELVTSVDTRESSIAPYLDSWKRKIERTGVNYLPEQATINGLSGSPTLEVIISASGQLQEVIVRRTSGSRLIDQAALEILRRAAPFDPFPEAIRVEYDTLRFAYKWRFNHRSVQSTASNF